MKWKDSGEMVNREENTKEEYFDEEQYSPWADRKENKKSTRLGKIPVLFVLLVIAIVALVAALLMLVMNGNGNTVTSQQLAALEERLQKYEERLNKFEAIDEKVTRIWDEAKSFEKFKDRFDRSEASMSLRMDHLTMGLEALQKQFNVAQQEQAPPATVPTKKDVADGKSEFKMAYHEVKVGETLYSISKKYGLKVEQLLKMNRMKPGSVIVPGQKLIVRGGSSE